MIAGQAIIGANIVKDTLAGTASAAGTAVVTAQLPTSPGS